MKSKERVDSGPKKIKLGSTWLKVLLGLVFTGSIFAQTSEFTYQGKLNISGSPANASYDMQFKLYDAETAGNQSGLTQTVTNVTAVAGIFTVRLDFESAAFTGADRFIEIGISPVGQNAYTTLVPRQKLTSAPFSIKAANAASADSMSAACVLCVTDAHIVSIDSSKITGVLSASRGGTGIGPVLPPADTYLRSNGSGWTASGLSGNGSALTNLNGANITNNTINASALASDTFPNNQNLSRLGSLRWDLLGQRVTVGSSPRFAAFDGANIWVANGGGGNVTKLRASDGAVQGTFAVGSQPFGVVFDGANIWVTNSGSNTVTKLRASDGALQGTFAVGTGPFGVAFDGANIWVANRNSNNVTKLRASDGAVQGTFAAGSFPSGLAFDGANIWATNASNPGNVTKLRSSDGALQGTFAVGINPFGVAFDGANIWVVNTSSNTVTKLQASDGACVGTCTFDVGITPFAVAFDGANMWVGNSNNTVTKLRASDGALQGTFPAGSSQGIVFDGANIWVVNFGGTVIKLPVFP